MDETKGSLHSGTVVVCPVQGGASCERLWRAKLRPVRYF